MSRVSPDAETKSNASSNSDPGMVHPIIPAVDGNGVELFSNVNTTKQILDHNNLYFVSHLGRTCNLLSSKQQIKDGHKNTSKNLFQMETKYYTCCTKNYSPKRCCLSSCCAAMSDRYFLSLTPNTPDKLTNDESKIHIEHLCCDMRVNIDKNNGDKAYLGHIASSCCRREKIYDQNGNQVYQVKGHGCCCFLLDVFSVKDGSKVASLWPQTKENGYCCQGYDIGYKLAFLKEVHERDKALILSYGILSKKVMDSVSQSGGRRPGCFST